jgi:hypothetical protein
MSPSYVEDQIQDHYKGNFLKSNVRHPWLMPIILAIGDRDQEDRDSKPARANSSRETLSQNSHHRKKRGSREGA